MVDTASLHTVTGWRRHGCAVAVVAAGILAPFAAAQGQDMATRARLSLFDAVRRGLGHDPGVLATQASSDVAAAMVGTARAAWFPTVNLTAALTQYEQPMIVSPIHGFQPGETPPFDETLVQAGATLHFTLFDGGARIASVRQARAQLSAADATLEEATQGIIMRVVATYLAALSSQQVLAAHDRRLDALRGEAARAQQRREVGTAADVDVLRVEAAVASAEAERVQLAVAVDLAERDLARLIGADVAATRAEQLMDVTLSDSLVPAESGLIARALEGSPAVQRARREAAATGAGQLLARSARWPHLQVVGAWIDRGSAAGNFQGEWNVGVQFAYPVFTGGAVSRGIARANAARRAADERVRAAEQQLAHDVDRARLGVDEARARVASLRTAMARFAEVARIEQLRLEAGAGTETDYLSAEAELLAARAQLVQAQHGEVAARVELARVIGVLDVAWLEQHLETVQ